MYPQRRIGRIIYQLEELGILECGASVIIYKRGNRLEGRSKAKRVAGPDTNHAKVINDALNYVYSKGGGVVKVVHTDIEAEETIRVKNNVELDLSWSKVTPKSDIDIFYLEEKSKLKNVRVYIPDTITFTKSAIKIHGEQKISSWDYVIAKNLVLENESPTGTAIHLLCENDGDHITNAIIDTVRIWKFEYGIKISTLVPDDAQGWINSNTFHNVRIMNSKYGVYMERNLNAASSGTNSNIFSNLIFLAYSNTLRGLRITGSYNKIFGEIIDMQWAASGALAIEFTSDSKRNMFIGTVDTDYVQDNGTDNIIIATVDNKLRMPNLDIDEITSKTGIVKFTGLTKLILDDFYAQGSYSSSKATDTAWYLVSFIEGESKPRVRISPIGTISFGDGVNAPNIVIKNTGGKARIYNVESIQLPLYTDCADLPDSGNFTGDTRACYDTGAAKWVIKVWDGSAWQTVG